MHRFLIFLLLIFSCSGSQQTQVEAQNKTPEPKTDTEALIKEVQIFRDLNFTSPPQIVAVQTLTPDIGPNIDSEYRFLNAIFPGPPGPSDETEFGARYNRNLHRIEYLSQEKGDKDRAIFWALVMALDAQQQGASFEDDSLDHYLANRVRQRSAASFLLVLRDLKKSLPYFSAERIANRPGSWLTSKRLSTDLLNKFTFRNAVIFGAAMYRSNKISGLEYGMFHGPAQSGAIKRPDRWLAGEGLGKWTLPENKLPEGYQLLREGQIGPLFLERAMGPEPAFSFWQGGHYRAYQKEGAWGFEWVTMWETPTAASVAGKMFRDFFTIQKRKGRAGTLSVIEKGNILAISGSLKGEPFWLERAKILTASQLVFYPAEKPFLHFIPTSLDALAALKLKRKNLSAPGSVFSEEILKDWKVERPKSGLWWYATLGKAAIIQCNVELRDLGPLSFSDEKYGEKWYSVFRSTVEDVKLGNVHKIDWNGMPTWEIDIEGKRSKADALRRIISRQYAYGEFVVSVSLVSDPGSTTAIQTFKNLVYGAKLTRFKE